MDKNVYLQNFNAVLRERFRDKDGTFRQLDNMMSELDVKWHASLNLFGRCSLECFSGAECQGKRGTCTEKYLPWWVGIAFTIKFHT